mgnify:CR=1 FL=1
MGLLMLCQSALVAHIATQDIPQGRSTEYSQLMKFLTECLDSQSGGALYLCGAAGTGKTLVTTSCLHRIQVAYDRLNIVFVNGASSANLATRLADELGINYEPENDNDARTKLFAHLVPKRARNDAPISRCVAAIGFGFRMIISHFFCSLQHCMCG